MKHITQRSLKKTFYNKGRLVNQPVVFLYSFSLFSFDKAVLSFQCIQMSPESLAPLSFTGLYSEFQLIVELSSPNLFCFDSLPVLS